jgi:hypothetical protein
VITHTSGLIDENMFPALGLRGADAGPLADLAISGGVDILKPIIDEGEEAATCLNVPEIWGVRTCVII